MEKRLTNYFRKEINIWAVPSNNVKRTVTYESKKLVTKFRLKDKTKFHRQNNIVYYSNIRMKHVLKITQLVIQISESKKELLTKTYVIDVCIYWVNLVIRTINIWGKTITEFWVISTGQFSNGKTVIVEKKTVTEC